MPNLGTRICLFLSSYFPLAVMLFVKSSAGPRLYLFSPLLALSAICLLVVYGWLATMRSVEASTLKIVKATPADGEAMGYVVTYMIPFLSVNYAKWPDVAAIMVVYSVIGIIYISSNLIHMNPMLNIVGFHVFEIEDSAHSCRTLICRRNSIQPKTELSVIKSGDCLLLEELP